MKELIIKLRKLNVVVQVVDDALSIEAPENVLTEALIQEIRENKQALIDTIKLYQTKRYENMDIVPIAESDSYELSIPQKRIWILSQFDAVNVAYNMPGVYEFSGALDIEMLNNAFHQVIARHEILRTTFIEESDGEVRQYIKDSLETDFKIDFHDFHNATDAKAKSIALIEELITQPFDLKQGPLLKASLFRVSASAYLFFFNMHHIISDGWSMGVLIQEVVTFYNARFFKRSANLSPLAIQYKDYANWQRKKLSDDQMNVHKNYWLDQFKNGYPLLELPSDKTRPALKTNNGSMVHGRLNAETVNALQNLIKPEGGTLFMGLMAGVKALLYRYTNQEDIVIGTPVAGRDHPDLENQIGFYINTLALRTQFDGTKDFKALYRTVKEVMLAGFEHQAYPFDELVDELNLKRDLSRSALFDVMVAIQNNEEEAKKLKLGEVEINQYQTDHVSSKFDLIFNFTEDENEIRYTVEYNTDIYSTEQIKRMRIHFECLMDFVVKDSAVPLNQIDFLSAKEKEVLKNYNQTEVSYPSNKTLIDLFTDQVEKTPDNVALIFDGQSYTYKDLAIQAAKLANYLHEVGQPLNQPIPIVSTKGVAQVWGVLGILMAGGYYIPIKGTLPEARINELIVQTNAPFVLAQKAYLSQVRDRVGMQKILLDESTFSKQKETHESPSALETDLAYIIFTSGSTGRPKGVMIDHRAAVNTLYDINARYQVTEKDKVFGISDLNFDLSVYDIFGTFAAGATLVVPKENEVQDPAIWANYIEEEGITVWDSVPQLVNLLANTSDTDLTSVRVYMMSGDWIPVDLPDRIRIKSPKAEVISMGGATEGAIWSIHYRIKEVNQTWKSIPYGYPLGNQEMYILNEALEPCPFNIPGGIYIGGKGVAKGYYKDEEKTNASFLYHSRWKKMLYRTGDYGAFHPDGYINFLGRLDGQVKIRGYRIEMGEVEVVLKNHPQIKTAVISTTPLKGKDRELVAYFIKEGAITNVALKSHLGRHLPEYMIPSYFVELEALPLTANGKLDRKALPDPRHQVLEERSVFVAPQSLLEQELATHWSKVLEIDKVKISVDDNFFDLGGHSLKVTQLRSLIEKTFEVKLNINELFTHVTIAEQGVLIAGATQQTFEKIPQVEASDYYLLSSTQRRVWVLSQFEAAQQAYTIPLAHELTGNLDVTILEYAFWYVLGRHEILRTVFNTEADGEVYQSIRMVEDYGFGLKYSDLTEERLSEAAITSLIQKEAALPFDLAQGPLLRGHVFQLEKSKSILVCCLHHIIADGWSLEIFLQEILLIYNALMTRTPVPFEPLPLQYKDYANWQRQQLEGEQKEKHQAYWLNRFAGELPVLDLPIAGKRPAVQTHRGAEVIGKLSASTTAGLKKITQEQDATLFMVLLTAIKTLFYRYTNQEDIVIGSPVAGRQHADLEHQIGLYINILALRTQFHGTDSFSQLLQTVKRETLEAYQHQVYPFDELVNDLDLKRDTSRSALFDVLLILHNTTRRAEELSLKDIEIETIEVDINASKYDMTFNFSELEDQIAYSIEYNTDIYEPAKVERMMAHFTQLLDAIILNPQQKIASIDYLESTEKVKLLETFNQTALNYPKDQTLLDLFKKQVETNPDSTALVCGANQMSYQEVDQTSNQLANYLIKKGVGAEDLVGVFVERSLDVVIGLLAILKAGGAFVPLDPDYPEERISYMIEDAEMKTILTQKKLLNKIPAFDGQCITMDQGRTASEATPDRTTSSEQLAYVIYTSGSTGKPKGVLIEHRNLMNFCLGMDQTILDSETERTLLALTTISFDISLLELFWTLTNGFKVIIQPQQKKIKNTSKPKVEKSTKPMDFSLFYFASDVDEQDKYALLMEGAKFADENGFSAIWTPERHFHEFGGIYPNPSVVGAAIAAMTNNLHIRAGSCVLPLHNPVRVVEEWSVVDNLSDGKVGLSFASGWVMNDFLALATEDYEKRHEVLYRNIEEVRRLWRGGELKLTSPIGTETSVTIRPKPIQKELPFWVTSAGNVETFRSAGKNGAYLLTHLLGQSVEDLKEKIAVYREARKEAGHEGEGYVTLMIHTYLHNDIETVKERVRKPFQDYLRHSVGLLRSLGKSLGQDVDSATFHDADMEALLDHAFNRYFETAALFGTPESCLDIVNQLSHIGVNELGCLFDFGLEKEVTLDGLNYLTELKENYKKQKDTDQLLARPSELVLKHQVTHMQCTPSEMKAILDEPDAVSNMESLKKLMLGGEALPSALVDKVSSHLSADVHNMYGPTETTIWSTTAKMDILENQVTIGKPIANTEIYILDENLQLLPIGIDGDIYIGGAGVGRGYLNRPELTAQRFLMNPYKPEERFYKTGDIGRWLSDGRIEYVGRKDDQVKIRGYRIELGAIETHLRAHDLIKDVVVSTTVNKFEELDLVAHIISTSELDITALRAFLASRLPAYMIPVFFVQLEKFPLTLNGKIDKKALRNTVVNQLKPKVEFVAPRNDDEKQLAEAWSELLGLEKDTVGIHDNFFELGGQSLAAIRLMGLINQELNIKIPLSLLFENPTIYEFVAWLNMHREQLNIEETGQMMEIEELI